MNPNVGNTDRLIRLVVGIALVALALITKMYWLLAFAALALVTAALRFCPLWLVLGIRTLKNKLGAK